jgi:predicted acylesterase/phospholipase RssA
MSGKIHLVLSSGGVKTLAYASAIDFLSKSGFEIASVTGCSAGTVFAACLAAGLSPAQLLHSVRTVDLKRYTGQKARGPGLLTMFGWPRARYKTSGLVDLFRDLVRGDPTFADLTLPFATLGVDLLSTRILVYSTQSQRDMRVSEAIRIATAVPFFYPPHVTDERVVIDGALVSDCPVWLAVTQPGEYPVVALRPRRERVHPRDQALAGFVETLVQLGGMSRDSYDIEQLRRVCLIEIDAKAVDVLEFDHSPEQRALLLNSGREAAEQRIGEIQRVAAGGSSAPSIRPPKATGPDATAELSGLQALKHSHEILSRQVRDRVFISYAHENRDWVDRLLPHLRASLPPGKQSGIVWDDSQIDAGANWLDEIQNELRSTRVAVLIVTSKFLISDFIRDTELPAILRAKDEDNLQIFWIQAEHAPREHNPLKELQCANDPNRPLEGLAAAEINRILVDISQRVALLLR